MDGYSCGIVITYRYPNTQRIHIGYDKIKETLLYYQEELKSRKTDIVFITDLNFSLDDLLNLYKLVKSYPKVKFIYIDHHDYNDKQRLVL